MNIVPHSKCKSRSTYINLAEYVGIFHNADDIYQLFHDIKDRFVFVIWESFNWINNDRICYLYLTLRANYPHNIVQTYRLKIDSQGWWINSLHYGSNFFKIGDSYICVLALYSFIMHLHYEQFAFNYIYAYDYFYESSKTHMLVRPFNKFQGKVWSLKKLASFYVDNYFHLYPEYLFNNLTRQLYCDIVLTQSYLFEK
jgi:hypothetical protein